MPIYLDHQATTPCDPRVIEAMAPTFAGDFGNAASRQHAFGRRAARLVEEARGRVAALIGCDPREIAFTSGATESVNLALKGIARTPGARGRHIVTCVTEHKAVLDSCQRLETAGFHVTYLPVDRNGAVRAVDVAEAISDDTALVSLMYANNEIGTVHPIAEIASVVRERGVPFHCDAAQALGSLPCRVDDLGVDLMSISAHKVYGPKGIGALYVRRRRPRVRLEPLIDGGGHERGLRSGTLNVPAIVGFGAACAILDAERETGADRSAELRNRLLEGLLDALPDTIVNGPDPRRPGWDRLPGNLNVTFPGVDAVRLLEETPEVAMSSGAACSSASFDSSYVLKSLPRPEPKANGGVRMGPGRFTTRDEIDRALGHIVASVRRIRAAPAAVSSCEDAVPPGDGCGPGHGRR